MLFGVGCGLALCIPLVAKNKPVLAADEQAERRQYADHAMEALREAIRLGFKDVNAMNKRTDLDPLRGRADFQRLFLEMFDRTFPVDPFAR